MAKKIIDIYHGDGITTYDEVCNATEFIIHKATQGRTYIDSKCKKRCEEFEKRKKPFWLYVFLENGNELDQVRFMLEEFGRFVSDKKYFIGWCLDIEKGNKPKNCIDAYKHLLGYCKKHNHKLMLYFSTSAYGEYGYKGLVDLSMNDREMTGIWEANYSSTKKPHSFTDLWQYSETGSCEGITTKCDLNKVMGNHSLSWFKTKYQKVLRGYTGTFPVLPDKSFGVDRKYYQLGDGYETLKNYPTQIKRVQELLKWAGFYMGEIDGKYGFSTTAAVKACQTKFGLPVNGKFGNKCLDALKAYKK